MAAHLLACAPCRAEAEGLAEVDRRLHRLGAYRGLSVAELVLRLDQQLGQGKPRHVPLHHRLRALLSRRPRAFVALVLLLGAALLLWLSTR